MVYDLEKQALSPIDRNVNWQNLFGRGSWKEILKFKVC